jgi:hypothetical protein
MSNTNTGGEPQIPNGKYSSIRYTALNEGITEALKLIK